MEEKITLNTNIELTNASNCIMINCELDKIGVVDSDFRGFKTFNTFSKLTPPSSNLQPSNTHPINLQSLNFTFLNVQSINLVQIISSFIIS